MTSALDHLQALPFPSSFPFAMGKIKLDEIERRSNRLSSRPGLARDRREVPTGARSSIQSRGHLPHALGAGVVGSRKGLDAAKVGGGYQRRVRSWSPASTGDEEFVFGSDGLREESMDHFYSNFLQDHSIEIQWSTSPQAGVNKTVSAQLDVSMAELEAVVEGLSGTEPMAGRALGMMPTIEKSTERGQTKEPACKNGKKQLSKTERTKWSAQEDEVLVSAWLNVSQDPIVGKDQSSESYWSRIEEYFNANKKGDAKARSMKGMVNHWALINECVSKYVGYLNQTDGLHRSGSTERERVKLH